MLFVSCGQGTGSGPADGGEPESAADAAVPDASSADDQPQNDSPARSLITLFRLGNDLCLPRQLPTSGATTSCRVLLEGVTAGCPMPGLSPATAADVAAIDAALMEQGMTPAAGAICEVTQLTAGVNCTYGSTPGWCYIMGSCLGDARRGCAQDICTSSAFDGEHVAYAGAWLTCS